MGSDMTTKPAHTPGPWRVGMEYTSDDMAPAPDEIEVCCGPVNNRTMVAGVMSATSNRIDDECRANARLIAAAPDLLAEVTRLKALNADLIKALEGLMPLDDRGDMEPYRKEWRVARAAIAKAKGAA